MKPLPLQQFLEQIAEETETVWAELLAVKTHVTALVEERLAWESFETDYNRHFTATEQERSNLKHRVDALERKLQNQRRATEAGIIHEPDNPLDPNDDGDPIEPITSRNQPVTTAQKPKPTINIPTGIPQKPADEPPIEAESQAVEKKEEKPTTEKNKKEVGLVFRRLFHVRLADDVEDEFLTDRMRLIANIINDKKLDEVDLLSRLPFNARDREAWYGFLTEEKGHTHEEHDTERLMRFRMWLYLLQIGKEREESRAEDRARDKSDDVYHYFAEWQESNQELLFYFQNLEPLFEEQLDQIRNNIADLQGRLDERQSARD